MDYKTALNEAVNPFHEVDGEYHVVTVAEAMVREIRRTPVEVLQTRDPASYDEYRQIKYAAGDAPTLQMRKAAYIFAAKRLVEFAASSEDTPVVVLTWQLVVKARGLLAALSPEAVPENDADALAECINRLYTVPGF
jgi:hypothetical protein